MFLKRRFSLQLEAERQHERIHSWKTVEKIR